jgi:hypothetical protein
LFKIIFLKEFGLRFLSLFRWENGIPDLCWDIMAWTALLEHYKKQILKERTQVFEIGPKRESIFA